MQQTNAERRFASRKFVLTSSVLVASTVLVLRGTLTPDAWSEVVRWVLGLYLAGNVSESAVARIGERASP